MYGKDRCPPHPRCANRKDVRVRELYHAAITNFTQNHSRYVWQSKAIYVVLLNIPHYFLFMINNYNYAGTPSISLSLTSPVDVISGNAVCSNTTVEFTCNASNVETFGWLINDMSIESWYIPTTSSSVQDSIRLRGHFEVKVSLEKISSANGKPPTLLSRLVGRVDQGLYNGDEISCVDNTYTVSVLQSLNLSYYLVTGK